MENKIHSAFAQVRASEQLKKSTERFLEQQRGREHARGGPWDATRRSAGWVRGLAAVCAVLVLVMAGGIWRGMVWTPVSYVSVDVNPSVELGLNRFDRVVSATAYSEDGALVLDGMELEGQPYTDAVEMLLDSEAMAPYLPADAELVITVAADADRQARLLEGVGACTARLDCDSVCYGADTSYATAAHECGMSLGKYTAWQTLNQYGQTLTEDECRGMTMGELHDRIHECEDGAAHHAEETAPDGGLGGDAVQSDAPAQSAAVPSQSMMEPSQSVPVPSQSANAGGHHSDGHHGSGHE